MNKILLSGILLFSFGALVDITIALLMVVSMIPFDGPPKITGITMLVSIWLIAIGAVIEWLAGSREE
jgi:hypothetical protein